MTATAPSRPGRVLADAARRAVRSAVRQLSSTPDNAVAGLLFDLTAREFRTDGMTFEVPYDLTTRRFRGRFFFGTYEGAERDLVRRHVHPDATVLEVGGCLGVIACETNQLLDDPTRHVVVEARPELAEILQRNRDRNAAGFAVAQGILDDGQQQGDEATFYVHDLIVGGSTHRATGRPITVPVLAWDDLVERAGGPLDTLVMDVEGAEVALLHHHADRLRDLRTAIVEWHDWIVGADQVERARDLLRDAGLHPVERQHAVEVWQRPTPATTGGGA